MSFTYLTVREEISFCKICYFDESTLWKLFETTCLRSSLVEVNTFCVGYDSGQSTSVTIITLYFNTIC